MVNATNCGLYENIIVILILIVCVSFRYFYVCSMFIEIYVNIKLILKNICRVNKSQLSMFSGTHSINFHYSVEIKIKIIVLRLVRIGIGIKCKGIITPSHNHL